MEDEKTINQWNNGFSIRVICCHDSFENRKDFVEYEKPALIKAVCDAIQKSPRIIRKIGDISYYQATEIIALQRPEIEIIFESKQPN